MKNKNEKSQNQSDSVFSVEKRIESLPIFLWEHRAHSRTFQSLADGLLSPLGYSIQDFSDNEFWFKIISQEDIPLFENFINGKDLEEKTFELTYRVKSKSGKLIWIRDTFSGQGSSNDEEKVYQGFTSLIPSEVVKRKEQETTAELCRQFVEEAPFAVTVYDSQGLLVNANEKAGEFWKIPIEEYVGHFNIFESKTLTDPESLVHIKKAFKGESGEIVKIVKLAHADQEERVFRIKYYPNLSAHAEIINVVYITEDVTAYLEAKEKGQMEAIHKQSILDALEESIIVIDTEGLVLNINTSFKKYAAQHDIDLTRNESIYQLLKIMNDDHDLVDKVTEVLEKQKSRSDVEVKLKDDKWYKVGLIKLEESGGAVISFHNINTRKEIEIALEKSLKKYRNIYNKAPVMIHSVNEKGEIISVSDYWLEVMGYDRREVIGRGSSHFLVEESRNASSANFDDLIAKGELKNVEYQFIKKSGAIIDVILSSVAEFDADGYFERAITGMTDISELKIANNRLMRSQQALLEAQRLSKIGNYEWDLSSGKISLSEVMSAIIGIANHGEISEEELYAFILAEDQVAFKYELSNTLKHKKDIYTSFRGINKTSQKTKWIAFRGRVSEDIINKKITLIGTFQDISEQKESEIKIRSLTDRVLLATEIANLGVWEFDTSTQEIIWEEQMYSIFTAFDKPASFKDLRKIILPEYQDKLTNAVERFLAGSSFFELELGILVENERKFIKNFGRVIRDEKGGVQAIVGVVYDITQDRKIREDLETSLEEKDLLIKEVHHRVKNNLQLISSIVALKSFSLTDEKAKLVFNDIIDRIKAMSVIHDKLYSFYNVSEIDVQTYLNHIAQELQILIGSPDITVEVDADQGHLNVDKALLIGLTVSELVANAAKHSFKKDGSGVIQIILKRKESLHVLSVSSDGSPVPQDVLVSNSGLGISLIKTFARQLEGEISISPNLGFTIEFKV